MAYKDWANGRIQGVFTATVIYVLFMDRDTGHGFQFLGDRDCYRWVAKLFTGTANGMAYL